MAKKKKKDLLEQTVNKILTKAEGIVDKLGMRDLIYALSYFSAVYIAYITWLKAEALVESIPKPLTFFKLIGGMFIIPFFIKDEDVQPDITKIHPEGLAVAFIAAYMVLKIDIADVKSAITILRGVVTGLS